MSSWDEYKKTMVVPANLWDAAKHNDLNEIARLLDAGADIDATDARGYSALMLATYAGHGEACDLLVARGADVSSCDRAGNSLLMGAAFKDQLELVRRLVALGADVSAKNHANMDA